MSFRHEGVSAEFAQNQRLVRVFGAEGFEIDMFGGDIAVSTLEPTGHGSDETGVIQFLQTVVGR